MKNRNIFRGPDDPVSVPDINLHEAICNAIDPGTIPMCYITESNIQKMTTLHGDSKQISNLKGLEYATYAGELILNDNQIRDLSPISGLINSLVILNLGNNKITQLNQLSALSGLTDLNLENNQITDISPISGLASLRDLNLENNQIADISSINKYLDVLNLNSNQIIDISPINMLTDLEYLSLNNNQITDISPISGLIHLRDLSLEDNQITDISPINGLTGLRNLNLNSNQITEILSISGLASLIDLNLGNNQITDISPISGFTRLGSLNLSSNQITDIPSISGLSILTDLNLANNQIVDIAQLASLTNLRNLNLTSNKITDISPINSLNNLTTLYLENQSVNLSTISTYNHSLTINNPLINRDSTPIIPSTISNSGTYDRATNSIIWNNLSGSTILDFEFSQDVLSPLSRFQGIVYQPFIDLNGPTGPTGVTGATGVTGVTGPTGNNISPHVAHYALISNTTQEVNSNDILQFSVININKDTTSDVLYRNYNLYTNTSDIDGFYEKEIFLDPDSVYIIMYRTTAHYRESYVSSLITVELLVDDRIYPGSRASSLLAKNTPTELSGFASIKTESNSLTRISLINTSSIKVFFSDTSILILRVK